MTGVYLKRHRTIFCFIPAMITFHDIDPILRRERFYAEIEYSDPQGRSRDLVGPKHRQFGCHIHQGY